MSNNTRATLLSRLKVLLNAEDDDFWGDTNLVTLLQMAFDKYFRAWGNINESFAVREYEMDYGAAADKEPMCNGKLYIVSGGDGYYIGETITGGTSGATGVVCKKATRYLWLKNISGTFVKETVTGATSSAAETTSSSSPVTDILGEDLPELTKIKSVLIKDTSEYLELVEATSLTNILRGSFDTYAQNPAVFFFNKEISTASTMGGQAIEIPMMYLRPIPSSAITLRIHAIVEPHSLSATTSTTGLPDFVEDCVLYEAGAQARLVEENPNGMQVFQMQLKEAEERMYRLRNRYVSGSDELIIRDWDLDY